MLQFGCYSSLTVNSPSIFCSMWRINTQRLISGRFTELVCFHQTVFLTWWNSWCLMKSKLLHFSSKDQVSPFSAAVRSINPRWKKLFHGNLSEDVHSRRQSLRSVDSVCEGLGFNIFQTIWCCYGDRTLTSLSVWRCFYVITYQKRHSTVTLLKSLYGKVFILGTLVPGKQRRENSNSPTTSNRKRLHSGKNTNSFSNNILSSEKVRIYITIMSPVVWNRDCF